MTYKSRRMRLACEKLERRLCLSAVSFAEHAISADSHGADSLYAADLDNDGDLDVLALHDNTISWYENIGGKAFGGEALISRQGRRASSVLAADVDGDGDMDVLDGVAWYENVDGRGNFGRRNLIQSNSSTIFPADLDADGDIDIVSASFADDNIQWYENTDGSGTFGPPSVVADIQGGARTVSAADFDGDGDLDVVSTSLEDCGFDICYSGRTEWNENIDGEGTFGAENPIASGTPVSRSVFAADVDGDGDTDVLSAFGRLVWYENTDGKGSFGEQRVIASRSSRSVFAADLDADGDVDVLSVEFSGFVPFHHGAVAWYENIDGKGSFGPKNVIMTTHLSGLTAITADLDGDGDTDVLSATKDIGSNSGQEIRIAWHENLTLNAGDANRDFMFDQQDIVLVLQAAKYLTGEPATFEDGDWNSDGIFNQLDIVAALATGNYLQGPFAST